MIMFVLSNYLSIKMGRGWGEKQQKPCCMTYRSIDAFVASHFIHYRKFLVWTFIAHSFSSSWPLAAECASSFSGFTSQFCSLSPPHPPPPPHTHTQYSRNWTLWFHNAFRLSIPTMKNKETNKKTDQTWLKLISNKHHNAAVGGWEQSAHFHFQSKQK